MEFHFGCKNLDIEIQGVKFKTDLLLLEMKGLDINWSGKYKAKVECENKLITLISPEGQKIFVKTDPTLVEKMKASTQNIMVEEGVSQIPIIQEYPDVFPK